MQKFLLFSLISLGLLPQFAHAKCEKEKEANLAAYAAYEAHHANTLRPASYNETNCLNDPGKKFSDCQAFVDAHNAATRTSESLSITVTATGRAYDVCMQTVKK